MYMILMSIEHEQLEF